MGHKVRLLVDVPDDLYQDVILPAKENHTLAQLVYESFNLYHKSTTVKAFIDKTAREKAVSDWSAELDSLNAAIGALDLGLGDLDDELAVGKDKIQDISPTEGKESIPPEGISDLKDKFTNLSGQVSDIASKVNEVLSLLQSGKVNVASQKEEKPEEQPESGSSILKNLGIQVEENPQEESSYRMYDVEDDSGEEVPSNGYSSSGESDAADSDPEAADLFASMTADMI